MLHALLLSMLSAALLVHAPAASRVTEDRTAASTPKPLALADSIVVEKHRRTLTLFHDGKPMHTYLVALGLSPVGDKVRAGDHRTPEGVFYIDARQPNSKYHLALHISYPDANHAAKSHAIGASPGGDIMIHGLPNGLGSAGALHRLHDWTDGCVALTDAEIEEIWSVVPIGTPIEIKP